MRHVRCRLLPVVRGAVPVHVRPPNICQEIKTSDRNHPILMATNRAWHRWRDNRAPSGRMNTKLGALLSALLAYVAKRTNNGAIPVIVLRGEGPSFSAQFGKFACSSRLQDAYAKVNTSNVACSKEFAEHTHAHACF